MRLTWTIFFAVIALGITCASGNHCNVSEVNVCYNILTHYEGLGFPLYGEDEVALDDTCRSINVSFECINDFVSVCHKHPECDETCAEMIVDIEAFSMNTGLKDLQADLCDPHSIMRENYLENYVCLEDNADKYAGCHNDSQLSQEYMHSIRDTKKAVQSRCCFFSWYQDCFTNITRDTCGDNATFFVSFSLHKLIGHIQHHLCKDNPIICERPPLPEGDLDKDKPDQTDNDIDNSVNDFSTDSSSHLMVSVFHIVLPLFCISFLSKNVFSIN